MTQKNDNDNQMGCDSCDHDEGSWNEEANLFLCTLCGPWVEVSLRRTENIPYWAMDISRRVPDVFDEVRNVITDNALGNEHWVIASCCAVPRTEEGWMQFLHWILGSQAQHELEVVRNSLDLREVTRRTSESVAGIRNQMRKQSLIGDDSIQEDGWGTWVNGILFGPEAQDVHCQTRTILPQLLFDHYHGLDYRPIEEMAYAYHRGPWMAFIGEATAARVPTTPALRELLNRIGEGGLGRIVADRFLAATVIWAIHVEREYVSCAQNAWARSFGLVREIAEESGGRVIFAEDGIYVEGESKNLYRIAPSLVRNLDCFEVRKYASIGGGRTEQICIHTSRKPHELKVAMGDVVASLVHALLEDVESANNIHTLRKHLPVEYQQAQEWDLEPRELERRLRRQRLWNQRQVEFEDALDDDEE